MSLKNAPKCGACGGTGAGVQFRIFNPTVGSFGDYCVACEDSGAAVLAETSDRCVDCSGPIDTDSDELCRDCETQRAVEGAELMADLAAGR